MKHREGHFEGPARASTYFQCWEPDRDPHAVVVISHGLAEHSGRYARLASLFVDRGYAVATPDHYSHGQSDGKKGSVPDFGAFTEALEYFRARTAKEYPGLPLILLGHSMGGLISANHSIEYPDTFAGCVLSGPTIVAEPEPSRLQLAIARFLSRFFPNFGLLQLDANGVNRDQEKVARYVNAPLANTGKHSARIAGELSKAMEVVQREAGRIELPLLILHGGDDSTASPRGSHFLDAHAGSSDKRLKIYRGLFHEVFNEPELDQIFAEVAEWCDELLSQPSPRQAAT